jgi:DNA-binding NtrC family response regulator
VTLRLPPLREREGDIQLLAHYFLDKYGRKYEKPPMELSAAARELMLSYHWPGNVRELEHVVASAVIAADCVILPQHLSLPGLADLGAVDLERTAYQHLGSRVLDAPDGQAGDRVFEVNFSCNLTRPVDLKRIRNEVAAESEGLIIAEAQKRLSLKRTELAAFLGIDPKTLRSKVAGDHNRGA